MILCIKRMRGCQTSGQIKKTNESIEVKLFYFLTASFKLCRRVINIFELAQFWQVSNNV